MLSERERERERESFNYVNPRQEGLRKKKFDVDLFLLLVHRCVRQSGCVYYAICEYVCLSVCLSVCLCDK